MNNAAEAYGALHTAYSNKTFAQVQQSQCMCDMEDMAMSDCWYNQSSRSYPQDLGDQSGKLPALQDCQNSIGMCKVLSVTAGISRQA